MRGLISGLLVVGLITTSSRDAAAQSANDYAAYGALLSTPVGALAPIMVSPGTKGEKAFDSFSGRYSHFSPKTGDGSNILGATFYHQAGMNAAVSGTVGYLKPSCPAGATCDGVTMLGADVHSTLWNSAAAAGSTTATSINLQGSLGYGHMKDGSALSFAVGVPLAISMDQASKARISAFVNPGFGWGRVSATGSPSESGTRPLIGGGASWTAPAGWGLHAGFQKVILKDGGNNFGLGFSWKM
jgi:hypothetical protein